MANYSDEGTTMSQTPGEESAEGAQQTGPLLARRLLIAGLLPALLPLYFAAATAQAVHPHTAIEKAHKGKSAAALPGIPAANTHGMGRIRLRRLSRVEYNNTVATCVVSTSIRLTAFPTMMWAMASTTSARSSLFRRFSWRNTWPLRSRSRMLPFRTRTISSRRCVSPLRSDLYS
jgi:hypothetical protein